MRSLVAAGLSGLLAVGCASAGGELSGAAAPSPTAPSPTAPSPTAPSATSSPAPSVVASATAGTASASPATVIPPQTSTPTPTPSPTLTGPHTLTEADSGATVRLHPGEQVNVDLSHGQWDPPTARGAAVQRTAATGGYPSQQPARATFRAVADGTATLQSTTDYACLHTRPQCMIAQRVWSVRVIVSS